MSTLYEIDRAIMNCCNQETGEMIDQEALDEYGVLRVCPLGISAAHRDSDGLCKNPERPCIDCRHEFWMQEVE